MTAAGRSSIKLPCLDKIMGLKTINLKLWFFFMENQSVFLFTLLCVELN